MKIGVIGAGPMGQGIAKAFAQVEGNTVALCDIKQINRASIINIHYFFYS